MITQSGVRFDWQRQRWPDPTRKVLRACLIGCAIAIGTAFLAAQWGITFYGAFVW